jgi:hypothetical protein
MSGNTLKTNPLINVKISKKAKENKLTPEQLEHVRNKMESAGPPVFVKSKIK